MAAADAEREIREIVDRETRAWDTTDVDLLLSIFHPDFVWPWPRTPRSHDPVDWVMPQGRFDLRRWTGLFGDLFAGYELVHNRRSIVKITLSAELDGAFAVVDVDTLWRARADGEEMHWLGRAGKGYARVDGGWKLTMHTGLLDYSGLG